MSELSAKAKQHLSILREWHQQHGLLTRPLREQHRTTYEWLMQYRKMAREGKALTKIRNAFEEYGLPEVLLYGTLGIHESHVKSLEKRFAQLDAFHQEHGHYEVPLRYPGGLGKWLQNTRRIYQRDPENPRVLAFLARYPEYVLHKIETPYNSASAARERWFERFYDLLDYAREHNCSINLPRIPNDPDKRRKSLAIWCYKQRVAYREGRLPWEYEKLLRMHGFEFEPKPGPKTP